MASLSKRIKRAAARFFGLLHYDRTRGLHHRNVRMDGGFMVRLYFRLDSKGDRGAIKQTFKDKSYDLSRFAFHKRLMDIAQGAPEKRLLVIDAGANIGASSAYFDRLFERAHVVAIEPDPNNFSVLKANSEGRRITPIHAAIAEAGKTMWLQDPGLGDLGFRVGSSIGDVEVTAITVDDLLRDHGAADFIPFIIKIDIEGGEEYLFSDNTEWMSKFALIIIELHDWLLPGRQTSRNFLREISRRNFDVDWRGENMFCFNNDFKITEADTGSV